MQDIRPVIRRRIDHLRAVISLRFEISRPLQPVEIPYLPLPFFSISHRNQVSSAVGMAADELGDFEKHVPEPDSDFECDHDPYELEELVDRKEIVPCVHVADDRHDRGSEAESESCRGRKDVEDGYE